ncbi:hypothetical protein AAFN87_14765 [Solibacillus sp. CAU 1738]
MAVEVLVKDMAVVLTEKVMADYDMSTIEFLNLEGGGLSPFKLLWKNYTKLARY